MKIENDLTDESVLSELGARLERVRLERNLTQRELAARAGVAGEAPSSSARMRRIEARMSSIDGSAPPDG